VNVKASFLPGAMLTLMATAITTTSCSRDISLLPPVDAGPGATAEAGAPRADAAAGGGAACSGLGDPITLPTAAGATCAAALSARAHRFALCACDSLNVTQELDTDTFDSSIGAPSGDPFAAIGVNGDLTSSARITAGGAVYVAGSGGFTTTQTLIDAGTFRVGATTWIMSGAVEVPTDAYLGGDVIGILLVIGTLHLGPNAITAQAVIDAGTTVREAVSVPPPCDCGATFVDIPAAITATAARNDDAVAGLDPGGLSVTAGPAAVDIPCGRFALATIDTRQPLALMVHGRALLAVTGDVTLRAGLTVALDPGAELDLLVGGRLLSSGATSVGSASPARFRIWVAGTASVALDDGPTLAAMLHAPGAFVTASAGLEVSGGLFARALTTGGTTTIHFDEAVLSSGEICGESPQTPVP
jgi:hypothetical protein